MSDLSRLMGIFTVMLLAGLASAVAQEPAAPPIEDPDEPVVGRMEHAGYGLVGSGGRHYVFGGLAVADYVRNDRRHIITLQLEEPTMMAKPDDDFLYFRELGSGHRWALGRHPLADDAYVVYFQPRREGAPNKWSLFHRARLIWPEIQGTAVEGGPQESHPQIPPITQKRKMPCETGP
ncbi:MAG TPA: hypothetical protein VMP01_14140 [Pirellulaceae bacterium]|nr:hypothetical protein [Pirellulaceae bacterium]